MQQKFTGGAKQCIVLGFYVVLPRRLLRKKIKWITIPPSLDPFYFKQDWPSVWFLVHSPIGDGALLFSEYFVLLRDDSTRCGCCCCLQLIENSRHRFWPLMPSAVSSLAIDSLSPLIILVDSMPARNAGLNWKSISGTPASGSSRDVIVRRAGRSFRIRFSQIL